MVNMVALNTLNQKFNPTKDTSRKDFWKVIAKQGTLAKWNGDCEDYSLTYAWLDSDKSNLKLAWKILTGYYKFYHVRIRNEGHLVMQVENEPQYLDNLFQEFVPKKRMVDSAYTFKKKYWGITVLLKWMF